MYIDDHSGKWHIHWGLSKYLTLCYLELARVYILISRIRVGDGGNRSKVVSKVEVMVMMVELGVIVEIVVGGVWAFGPKWCGERGTKQKFFLFLKLGLL